MTGRRRESRASRRGWPLAIAWALLLFPAFAGAEPPPTGDSAPDTPWVMGSPLVVQVHHASPDAAERARQAALAEARRLDNLLSPYLPYSPLSRLNERAGRGLVEVSPELAEYLRRARIDSRRTDGAFDITVGALLAAHRSDATAEELRAAREHVGMDRLEWSRDEATGAVLVSLPPGMVLDPGGDGKGVAVDAMAHALEAEGIQSAFIDFGESAVYGLGTRPDGSAWKVAIDDGEGRVLGIVRLQGRALSVSSALGRAEGDRPRSGHIVDPRSGSLVERPRTAVVVATSATDADVLSTALIVAGREQGARFATRFPDAEMAVFEAGASPWMTRGFARLLEPVD